MINFNLHFDKICLKTASQLNALVRLKLFSGNEDWKVLTYSFALSIFNFCLPVWMLANAKSLHKIGLFEKRALRFMLNDYESFYKDLLKKSGIPNMILSRTKSLWLETYKTINDLNPKFMKNLFKVPETNRALGE